MELEIHIVTVYWPSSDDLFSVSFSSLTALQEYMRGNGAPSAASRAVAAHERAGGQRWEDKRGIYAVQTRSVRFSITPVEGK